MFDPKLVDIFIQAWKDEEDYAPHDAYAINHGWCYQFALVLWKLTNGKATLMSGCDHAWIRYGGDHFDAEHMAGCGYDTLNRKACDSRYGGHCDGCEARPFNYDEFVNYWGDRGKSGEVHDKVIEETLRRYKAVKR